MSAIQYQSRILNRVGRIVAPEKELFGEYFILLTARLREAGLEIAVDHDMAAFGRVCAATGKFFPNVLNPDASFFPRDAALWMNLQSAAGERVATIAIRLFDLGKNTLGDWLSTLSFFYAAPAQDMASGERFVLGDEADAYANTIRHRCTYIGGLWIDPTWRGRTALAEILTTAGCALALARWDSAPVVAIVEDEVYAKNASKYRFDRAFSGVRWLRPRKPERSRMWLLGRTRQAVVSDVARFVVQPSPCRLAALNLGSGKVSGNVDG
ncbi:MAG: hypothetical protein NXI18_09225 [Alphaproteobacteria bacterium]|nr:hypothetical protein [Alphaproteobacteria bacterium]